MSTDSTHAWSVYESPFGPLVLTGSAEGLGGLFFPGRGPFLDEAARRPERFAAVVAQLDEYFAGARRAFDLRLDLSAGTAFQQGVWGALQAIPYGTTISYRELARRIGRIDRVRAVGAAVGANPLPILVACHRVIGADGSLTGYRGGLRRKQALLDTEQAVVAGDGAPVQFGTRQIALL